jgi:cytoskeletal protein RodZ
MALFNNNSSELPESQIEYKEEGSGKRWATLLIYVVLALVVATLVVFAGRWVYHKVSNNSEPAQTTITTESTQQGVSDNTNPANPATPPANTPSPSPSPSTSATPPSSSSQSQSGKTTAPTPTPTPAPKSKSGAAPSPTTTPSPTPTSLPNNGPGEVIAAIVGATFLGYLFDIYTTKRRLNKNI